VDPLLRHTLNELNGDVFLRFLEQLSGARGLLGDPKFRGAGAHLTLPGGHLDLHADFNRDRFRGLQRSLTMLLYLNPGWQDAWGGALELWPADLSACGRRVLPRHNRCVILQNGDTCFHGHPQPLACPEGVVRQSLAAYYYRSDERERADDPSYTPGEAHGALWVKPPGAGENEP
jgi:hypothetical protein